MQALRGIVACMPAAAARVPQATLVRTADALVAVASCNACSACMGYVPEALLQATHAHINSLSVTAHDAWAACNTMDAPVDTSGPPSSPASSRTTVQESLDGNSQTEEEYALEAEAASSLADWLLGALVCHHTEPMHLSLIHI